MSLSSNTSIKDCLLEVTNIKISVNLPFIVSLEFVEDRCKSLQPINTNIFCSRKKQNILTIRYNNFTYILFKSSSKFPLGSTSSQHCNITKLKSYSDILKAIEYLFYLVDEPPVVLNYSIDNYSCCGNIFKKVDITSLYINQTEIACNYNEENFPAVTIYCPQELKEVSRNLCCLVYRTGCVVLVGGKKLEEIEEFFSWVIDIVEPYTLS